VASPVADVVTVDAELRGCPIDGGQLLELLTAVATGRRPQLPDQAVCLECKRRGAACVVVAHGLPCLGPVTQTGCGAICPRMGRGCYGCFGPREGANVDSLATWFISGQAEARGEGAPREPAEVGRLFAGFTGAAPAFRAVTDRLRGLPVLPLRPTLARPSALAGDGPPRWTHEHDPSGGAEEEPDARR
jgi:sulfhydrogenase subunit delta